MSLQTPQNPIFYQNTTQTITLIDIPTSIAYSQGTSNSSNLSRKLLSTEPLKEPFASPEPKSEKARLNLMGRNSADQAAEEKYLVSIEDAIREIRENWKGEWCAGRRIVPAEQGRKRKRGDQKLGNGKPQDMIENSSTTYDYAVEKVIQGEKFLRGEERLSRIMKAIEEKRLDGLRITITSAYPKDQNEPDTDIKDLVSWDGIWYNEHPHPVLLSIIEELARSEPICFHIPPLSTFLLSDCAKSSDFRNTIRSLASAYSTPRSFNLILLDPPWPNTSAKRKSSYSTASQLRDLKRLLISMDLDTYIASSGYVGIWITNAPAVRNLVLGTGGLLEAWNVSLVEEWIWVKTTVSGEPVTPVDGMWRKPFEIFLIGRAPGSRLEVAQNWEESEVVKRIIFGVPDLHSRKPCLKEMVERLGFVKKDGRVLEGFARYCVAGWWSWGNEVLKFNWDGYWEDNEGKSEIEIAEEAKT
jgi:N6-adenosine-specific RNA methylase IME4